MTGEIGRKWCQRSRSGEWPQISSITWKFYKELVCHLGCQLKYGCAIWIRKGKQGGLLSREDSLSSPKGGFCAVKRRTELSAESLSGACVPQRTFFGLIMSQRLTWFGSISYIISILSLE